MNMHISYEYIRIMVYIVLKTHEVHIDAW